MGAYVSVMARSAKNVQDYGIAQDDVRMLWLGAVHVVGVIQLSRSSQASSWLEHQDDFAGLTCIGWRECGM